MLITDQIIAIFYCNTSHICFLMDIILLLSVIPHPKRRNSYNSIYLLHKYRFVQIIIKKITHIMALKSDCD